MMKKMVQHSVVGGLCLLVTLLAHDAISLAAGFTDRVNSEKLGGEARYLAYVSTDKPIYRGGETVFLRSIFLNAHDNTPVLDKPTAAQLKIRGPKGDTVFNQYASGDDSTAGVRWDIPPGMPGGVYTALVTSHELGTVQSERQFEIRAFRAPRLKTRIEFARDGYGPGDEVRASVNVKRAEGSVPEGAQITLVARVDGKEVSRQAGLTVPSTGTLSASFALPSSIEQGQGSVSFIVEDGGVVETASKTLPLLLQTLDIRFYPEGGDLVAGLPGRVYVQALRPDGKPADIAGRVVELNHKGKADAVIAARLRTQHEGRGVFTITPKAGKKYALVLSEPSGMSHLFKLPEALMSGTVIQSSKPVFDYDEAITVHVRSRGKQPATRLTLHKREQTLADVNIAAGPTRLDPQDGEGVLILTAWDATGKPVAERLVYRRARFAVNLSLSAGDGPWVPGSEVELEILATDTNGNPVEAVVGVTVTDDTVLELIEKREQAPRLPVMVYLENEVRDLADAQIYLDAANAESPAAVDLLLGTQGWRRYILVDYDRARELYSTHAMRALAERDRSQLIVLRKAQMRNRMLFAPQPMRIVPEVAALENEEPEAVVAVAIAAGPVIQQKLDAGRARQDQAFEAAAEMAADDIALFAGDEAKRRVMPQVSVREYAFTARPDRKPGERIDFAETLYWHKGIRTSARDGKATVRFSLSDSVTSFRALADAFGRNGALGSGELLIESIEPFYVEPKLPLNATVGDVIDLPITLVNATDRDLDARVSVSGTGFSIEQPASVVVAAGQRVRQTVRLVAQTPGKASVELIAQAGPYADRVVRSLTVKPAGFPVAVNHGGLLGPQQAFSVEVIIPETMSSGTLASVAKVYPSPLASMEEALDALLREPHGCFEQASSSNYPLVMAQQYFTSHQGIDPQKIASARALLKTGYDKLTGFESEDNGYEWFGANPAHEALTAYGLMEFVDMAKVMPVDEAMIKRTRRWLLDRRDGQGGFIRNEKALDSFGRAPAPTTNAYILWALLESGENPAELKQEIAAIRDVALVTEDSYVKALAANILFLAGDSKQANLLAAQLAEAVNQQGAVADAETSITRSGGDALAIETTSLALLAWLKDDDRWAAQVETSMKWLFERSKSGRFGSTQSTVLALKAINAYDAARAIPRQPGAIQVMIDGKVFGQPVQFSRDSRGAIDLPDFSALLTPGSRSIALQMLDGSKMPFALEITYNTKLPAGSAASTVMLETALSTNSIEEGEPLELNAVLKNGNTNAPTPMAILGIPAGLEVRYDQLKELVAADRISAFEVIGNELVLYWRALPAAEARALSIGLTAVVPGQWQGPASRSYLYYTDEHKHWNKGLDVIVKTRSQDD